VDFRISGSDNGALILYSDSLNYSSSTEEEVFVGFVGPYLSVLHNYNYCLKNNIFNIPGFVQAGVIEGIDNTNPNNYFRFNTNQSNLSQYEDVNEPFLIERGDEIRVTYISSSVTYNQDFQVLGVDSIVYSCFKWKLMNNSSTIYKLYRYHWTFNYWLLPSKFIIKLMLP
jgi:hypothetical protein